MKWIQINNTLFSEELYHKFEIVERRNVTTDNMPPRLSPDEWYIVAYRNAVGRDGKDYYGIFTKEAAKNKLEEIYLIVHSVEKVKVKKGKVSDNGQK
jgi:hypothetical protein